MRRIVWDVFAGLGRVLMMPCLRDTTLLENDVRTTASRVSLYLLDSQGATSVMVFQGVLAWAGVGGYLATGRDTQVSSHQSVEKLRLGL